MLYSLYPWQREALDRITEESLNSISSEELEELLQKFEPDWESCREPIIYAVMQDEPSDLKKLLLLASKLVPGDARKSQWFVNYSTCEDLGLEDPSWISRTPLSFAIERRHYDYIKMLLQAGANPLSTSQPDLLVRMSHYKREQLDRALIEEPACDRGTPSILSEYVPFSTSGSAFKPTELPRRIQSISPFWDDSRVDILDPCSENDALHSLVRASLTGDIEMFNLLWEASPDSSYWIQEEAPKHLPSCFTPSAASVSTPLHAAVCENHMELLDKLLELKFNPNIMPFAAGASCQTPLQVCFSRLKPQMNAFRRLMMQQDIDTDILTPVFRVHLLHFAISHLNVEIMEEVLSHSIKIQSVPRTILGHTLLHVVCLPEEFWHVQVFAPKVYQSIHECRFQSSECSVSIQCSLRHNTSSSHLYGVAPLPRPPETNVDGPGFQDTRDGCPPFLGLPVEERRNLFTCCSPPELVRPIPNRSKQQYEIAKWLLEQGVNELELADAYGNTPMHYLASYRRTNNELIAFLRRRIDQGDYVWLRAKNIWGFTPSQLWMDNVMATEEEVGKTFWPSTTLTTLCHREFTVGDKYNPNHEQWIEPLA
jgi:ankyrin repeat protein